MRFLKSFITYKLNEAAMGDDKTNKLFIGTVADEYNKYSENAKEAILHLIENTPDDVLNKMIQYIGVDANKSKNLLSKIVTGLQKEVLTKAEPSKITYYGGKSADYIDKLKMNLSSFTVEVKNTNILSETQYATLPLGNLFNMNSSTLSEEKVTEITENLKTILKNIDESKPIIIKASCSTLRNREEAANLTWMELSQKRADAIKGLISKYKANAQYQIDVKGENGDGTTGNKSPLEDIVPNKDVIVDTVNGKPVKGDGVKKHYELLNIDPKFWKSAAKDAPLGVVKTDYSNMQELVEVILPKYLPFQKVDVSIPIKYTLPPDFNSDDVIGITIGKSIKPKTTSKISPPQHKFGKYKANTCPI
jgi:outer membrane protein OmpA-like peptidoglycan-associated protein